MKATKTFHLYDPETARTHVFTQGAKVPDHLAPLIGDHVVDRKPKAEKQPDPAPAGDPDASGNGGDGGSGDGGGDLFDPSAKTADEVADYLRSLDPENPDDVAEYERVVQAEKDGKNRSTALPA